MEIDGKKTLTNLRGWLAYKGHTLRSVVLELGLDYNHLYYMFRSGTIQLYQVEELVHHLDKNAIVLLKDDAYYVEN